jgi:hypothetical protein
VGVDAARSFGTGCFKDHRTHDLRGLTEEEMNVSIAPFIVPGTRNVSNAETIQLFQGVKHWKKFFKNSEKYKHVGKVIHPPIDPKSPIPPHCKEKKKAEARAATAGTGHGPKNQGRTDL